MKLKSTLLIFLSLLTVKSTFATVDYLVVNHITEELYWGETDHEPGFVGWESIPESKWIEAEREYLKNGYSMTKNPYKIELGLGVIIFILGVLIFMLKKYS